MPEWLINALLPFVIQAFTPMIVLAAKRAAEWLKLKMPGPVVLMLAATVAEGINQVGPALTGVPSLPPAAAATVAVGLREFWSQLVAQPTGMEDKPLVREVKEAVKEAEARQRVPGQLGGDL